jgi:hypothetical protein
LGQRLSEWCGHGPILEEDIEIDENNNIDVYVSFPFFELWEKEFVLVNIGKTKTLSIETKHLRLRKHQSIIFVKAGISKANIDEDIYDVSEKGDIFVHIEIIPPIK